MDNKTISLDKIIIDSLDLIEKQVGEKYSKYQLENEFIKYGKRYDGDIPNIMPEIIKKWRISKESIIIIETCAHRMFCRAISFDSIEKLEKYLLGRSSYLNFFCTYAIPIIYGKIKDFDVYTFNHKKIVKYIFDEISTLKDTENCYLKWL